MTDTKSIRIAFMALVGIAVALMFYVMGIKENVSFSSAPSGLPATMATTSQTTLGTTALSLFATSSCAARIISTTGQAIMLTFSDYAGQTPTGSFGVIQSASTTVEYDSGQYGCGLVKGISFASQLITLVETR